jgi:hypothetical protein
MQQQDMVGCDISPCSCRVVVVADLTAASGILCEHTVTVRARDRIASDGSAGVFTQVALATASDPGRSVPDIDRSTVSDDRPSFSLHLF